MDTFVAASFFSRAFTARKDRRDKPNQHLFQAEISAPFMPSSMFQAFRGATPQCHGQMIDEGRRPRARQRRDGEASRF